MKTIISIFILFMILGCSQDLPKQDKSETIANEIQKPVLTKELPLLVVKKESLYPLFDSVINFEKRCSYYQEDLYFFSDIQSPNRIVFGSGLDKAIPLSLKPIGYFYYRNHCFFVRNQYNQTWFSVKNEKKTFEYMESEPFKDDRWTTTVYSFEKGKFTLIERGSYCE